MYHIANCLITRKKPCCSVISQSRIFLFNTDCCAIPRVNMTAFQLKSAGDILPGPMSGGRIPVIPPSATPLRSRHQGIPISKMNGHAMLLNSQGFHVVFMSSNMSKTTHPFHLIYLQDSSIRCPLSLSLVIRARLLPVKGA